jgi:hypothetical protein
VLLVGHFDLFPLTDCEWKQAGLLVGHFVEFPVVVKPLFHERSVLAEYAAIAKGDECVRGTYNLTHSFRVCQIIRPPDTS